MCSAGIALFRWERHWRRCSLLLTALIAVLPHGGFSHVDPGHVMYHFMPMIVPVCNPLPSLGYQSYLFSYLHKTVGAVLYFSSNSCSSIDLNFVFVLPIECSSTVGRSDAPAYGRAPARRSIGRCSRQRSLSLGWRMRCDLALLARVVCRRGLSRLCRRGPLAPRSLRARRIRRFSVPPFSRC